MVTVQGTECWQGIVMRSEASHDFLDSALAPAGEPEPPPSTPENESEGGGRVEKVPDPSTLSPPLEEKRKGVGSSSTFSTFANHNDATPQSLEEPAWVEEVP